MEAPGGRVGAQQECRTEAGRREKNPRGPKSSHSLWRLGKLASSGLVFSRCGSRV